MDILVLSTSTGGAVGVLRIQAGHTGIYDPVTGRKKYSLAGVEGDDGLVLPRFTTAQRTAKTPANGAILYDTDTQKVYVGNGVTAGGVVLGDDLYTRMGTAEGDINTLNGLLEAAETAIDDHETRIYTLETGDLHILQMQFAFFHASGWQTFDRLECGEFAQDGPYPVDWRFGNWSHDGLIMQFNNWAA